MAIIDFLKKQFIDIIEWTDDSRDTLSYRYPDEDKEIKNGAQLIGLAAGGTGIIFFSLATLATVTRKDFSFMGKFLFIGLILLIIASLANLFFQVPALALTISVIAILIFSAYILFDVSRIVHGGETNYVMATLGLFLSIYNLFINLLSLLMAFSGERD